MSSDALERVIEALRQVGSQVGSSGSGFSAQCPAHQDKSPSLSVTPADDRVLLVCHAGCDVRDVASALGLQLRDLFDSRTEYRYPGGRIVHRGPGKQFRQSGATRTDRSLYHQDRLRVIEPGQPVYVVEGEKDVHSAEIVGAVAVCSPMGAGKWDKIDPSPLFGRDVIIVADRDEPGRGHARQVWQSLVGKAAIVRVVEAAAGKDLTDHLNAGHTLDELVEVIEPGAQNGAPADGVLVVTPASAIVPRRTRWIWNRRIPLGALTLFGGPEGQGKSTLVYWLAARVTLGELDGVLLGQPRAVMIVATEDAWAETIVPRLIAHGADLTRILKIEARLRPGSDVLTGVDLQAHLGAIEEQARTHGAALLILDPLLSRLPAKIDTHKDAETRQALEPLAAMLERPSMSAIGLIHMNKNAAAGSILDRIMASKALTAVARAVHLIIPDPTEIGRRLFGLAKSNLGRTDIPVLTFTIVETLVDTEDGPSPIGRVVLGPDSTVTLDEAMAVGGLDSESLTEATDWLSDYLEQEGRGPSAEIKAAARKAGIAEATLKRAKVKLGVRHQSNGFPRTTWWYQSGYASPEPATSEEAMPDSRLTVGSTIRSVDQQ